MVAVVLFYGLYRGYSGGNLDAKSETVISNARAVVEGLNYFYADQNRYPSQEEFADANLMLAYISGYPPASIAGGPCTGEPAASGGFTYRSLDFKTYELDFCLPSKTGNFPAGLNTAKR